MIAEFSKFMGGEGRKTADGSTLCYFLTVVTIEKLFVDSETCAPKASNMPALVADLFGRELVTNDSLWSHYQVKIARVG